jgi:hypothetical protein
MLGGREDGGWRGAYVGPHDGEGIVGCYVYDVVVGALDVFVGRLDVFVGGLDVFVGGLDVFVGGLDVVVGGRDLLVGGRDVLVGEAKFVLEGHSDDGVEEDTLVEKRMGGLARRVWTKFGVRCRVGGDGGGGKEACNCFLLEWSLLLRL